MTKRKVLVTGASGKIVGQLLPAFRERYDLVLLDVKTANREGDEVEGIQIADLTDDNRGCLSPPFQRCRCCSSLWFCG